VAPVASPPRIIGGRLRGRKLLFSGDSRTRPMKDRVREAVFNLLGPAVRGTQSIDLFAGTGALGLEAISRGAARALFIERHFPTAELIRRNIQTLGVEPQCEVLFGDALVWARQASGLGQTPWVVFCSPPFDFYAERCEDMLRLIATLLDAAPAESTLVVEADGRFDFARLPQAEAWMVREYRPAVIGIYHKPAAEQLPVVV
jgi:16S rRNA (guanine966-N2)-methyltransferase